MLLKNIVRHAVIPATAGALASVGFDDISVVEGAKQAFLAGAMTVPLLHSKTSKEGIKDERYKFAADHPYLMPLVGGAMVTLAYLGGGEIIEALTPVNVNNALTSAAGFMHGAAVGIGGSMAGRKRYSP